MLSKTAATITTSALQTQANSYFKALFTRPEATGLTVNATFTNTNGNQVVVTATANVKTNFMNLMGFSTMQVAADSQVKWGNSRLRVALVLDNTGSMADDGKMPALITAAKTLLTQLQAAAVNNGDVYVSIVPFVKDVNVGASQLQGDLDRLDRLEQPTTAAAATRTTPIAKATARRTARLGRPTTITPGTAA